MSGAGVTEDVEAIATDEAIRAGGVMEGLPPIASSMGPSWRYHFQDAAVGSPSSVQNFKL